MKICKFFRTMRGKRGPQRFGAKKDPYDPKAWEFTRKLRALPPEVDLSEYRPPIKSQGDCGSCVGMALSSILTAEANKLGIILPDYQRFSETDIYNGGRYIDGSLMQDMGTYPSSALEWLRRKNCLPYKFWPYIGFETQSRPSSLDPFAEEYPLEEYESVAGKVKISYYRVTDGVDGITGALAEQHMVAIGIPWPKSWTDSKDGVLPTPGTNDRISGGHEVYLYGYKDSEESVFGGNSWGESIWSYTGEAVPKGCFKFNYKVFDWFKQHGGYDAHIVLVDWENEPEPEPPEPEPPGPPATNAYKIDGQVTLTPVLTGVV